VVCGSMSVYADMLRLKSELLAKGIASVIPEADEPLHFSLRAEEYEEMKRRASMRHIRRIRDQSTLGIVVVNPQRHGIINYVGANTFAEVAIAFAHYKRIYLLHGLPDFYEDELRAWGVVSLGGDLEELVADHEELQFESTAQLPLFS